MIILRLCSSGVSPPESATSFRNWRSVQELPPMKRVRALIFVSSGAANPDTLSVVTSNTPLSKLTGT